MTKHTRVKTNRFYALKIIVDKSEKQSIMNISTKAIVLKRLTTESESIMSKAKSKIATTSIASAIAATAAHAAEHPAPVVAAAPQASAPAANSATITTAVAVNKADKARVIFAEAYAQSPVPQRKEIIGRMVAEAGLTKAGAATYLQNFKTKAGLVVKRTPAAA